MRTFRKWAVAATTIGVLLAAGAGAATAASASPSAPAHHGHPVLLRAGETTVWTAPGIAGALLSNGIVPIATLPGTAGAAIGKTSATVRFRFPVTGGSVGLKPLRGAIRHAGGILFFDPKTGGKIEVSNFIISLKAADLTGIVNGDPHARVALFDLSLGHARLHVGRHQIVATGIQLTLTAVAASALDATFGTTLFTSGMLIGTASTHLHI
jgi:hypothetical protein